MYSKFLIFITIVLLLNILYQFNYGYLNNKDASVCNRIIRERESYIKNIHYSPHSRCGISHHLIDLMDVLLLSLILKRKLHCIFLYILVGLWKYRKDYFSLCHIKDSQKQYNYSNMDIYYIIPDSRILNPKMQFFKIKNSTNDNIIVNLHVKVSYYFSNKENQFINNVFQHTNESRINRNELFYIFMNYIYQPSYIIVNKVNKFLKRIEKNFVIGIHVRTGISADFKENAPFFGGINSTNEFIKLALNMTQYNNNAKWIVCADSSNISNIIKEKNKKYIVNYNEYFKYPSRLRHSRDYILKRYNIFASSVLIEIELLSNCNYLILSEGSMVSRISFIKNKNCRTNPSRCIFVGMNSDEKVKLNRKLIYNFL